MKKPNNRLSLVVIFFWSLFLIVLLSSTMVNNDSYSALPTDLQQEPIPKLDFDDPAKSIVVFLTFEQNPSPSPTESPIIVTPISVTISSERARTNIGDPRLLIVNLLDKDENLIDTFNTWNPLWTFIYDQGGKEHMQLQNTANGTIVFPFDPRLAWMDLFIPTQKGPTPGPDIQIARINLSATVMPFCTENPNDPNCRTTPDNDFCENNPDDPDCRPTTHKDFCKQQPMDPKCNRLIASANTTNLSNLTNNTLSK